MAIFRRTFVVVLAALVATVFGAACNNLQMIGCVQQAGIPLDAALCSLQTPDVCDAGTLCMLEGWKAFLACTVAVPCDAPVATCNAQFMVCDAAFRTAFCTTPAPTLPSGPTPAPATPAPPTLPPGLTGVSGPSITTVRPQALTFALVAEPTSRLGCSIVIGNQAAFQETNRNGGINGLRMDLLWKNSPDVFGIGGTQNALESVMVDNVFAVAGLPFESSVPAQNALGPLGIPVLGATPGDATTLYDAATATNALNYRPGYDQELSQIISFGLNRLKCKRFGMFWMRVATVKALADLAEATLRSLQGVNVTVVSVPYPTPGTYEEALPYLDQMYEGKAPQCLLLMFDPYPMPFFTQFCQRHPKYEAADFLAASLQVPYGGTIPVEPTLLPGMHWYGRMYFSQVLPDARDAKSAIAKKYRDAIASMTDPLFTVCNPRTPSPQAFEAYVAGRMLAEILTRMNTFTREELIKRTYETKMFQLDDIVLGPFNNDCTQKQLTKKDTDKCFCNMGLRTLYMARIDGTTGSLYGISDNTADGEFSVAKLTAPAGSCRFSTAQITVPALFAVVIAPQDLRDIEALQFITLVNTVKIGLNQANQATYQRMFFVNDSFTGPADAAAAVERLEDRYTFAGLLGPSLPSSAANGFPIFDGWSRAVLEERDAAWDPAVIRLRPVLGDHVHALVAFAHFEHGSTLHVMATSSSELSLATLSLNTFQREPVAETFIGTSGGVSPAAPFVLVVTQDSVVLGNVLSQTSAFPGTTFLVACSEELLSEHVATAAGMTNVLFASMFPRWWASGSRFSNAYLSMANAAADAVADAAGGSAPQRVTPPSPMELRAQLVASVLFTGGVAAKTPSDMNDWLFLAGEKGFDGVSIGPFSNQLCASGAANCECSKGPKTFHVHSLSDWAAANETHSVTYSYSHEGCGAKYQPLQTSSTNVVLIAVVTVVCALVVAAFVAVILVSRKGGRDNAAAPVDPDKPFAMVFTDIQASTTLWAKVPDEMTIAVETHHALIRELIKKCGGYEVKTIGDSFMVAFKDPTAAVSFAVQIQHVFMAHDWGTISFDEVYQDKILGDEELEDLPQSDKDCMVSQELWSGIRVRVGVHYGSGNIQLDPVSQGYDYYGTVVNTAARVEGVGHGGQVLITDATHQAVFGSASSLPHILTDAAVLHMGPQPLRGLNEPVVLYQVVPNSVSRRFFPPLRLDVVVDMEGDNYIGSGGSTTTSRQSSASATDTVETLASKLSRAGWKDPASQQAGYTVITQAHLAIESLLATSDAKYKSNFIHHVADKWRIPYRKSTAKTDTQRKAQYAADDLLLVQVIGKAAHSMEAKVEAKLGGNVKGGAFANSMMAASMTWNSAPPMTPTAGQNDRMELSVQSVSQGDVALAPAPKVVKASEAPPA